MNNYQYLIASLPDISLQWKGSEEESFEAIVDWAKGMSSASDCKLIDFLLSGYQDDNLDLDFYTRALSHSCKFLRDYFRFDLNVRNAKVRYLNKMLGRPANTDIFMEAGDEFEEADKLEHILASEDILTRERGIDELMWAKIDGMTTFDWFNVNVVLGFIAKLHIVSRWLKLDAETGKQMFGRIVDEVRGSYTGIRDAADAAVR